MAQLDWIVLFCTLAFIVVYGVWKTLGSRNLNDYLLANKEARWWTVGLSVMATQASAITFLSTPGQAYHDGMSFVQFYFGLPLAMVVICIFFIPIYHKLKVYTAYEYLETRFDLKTRTLTALLFLIHRSMGAGITICLPSIILSTILGWDFVMTNIVVGSLVILYTVTGGTKAVNVTQKQQMAVIFIGLVAVFWHLLDRMPSDYSFNELMDIANLGGKLNVLDFSLDFDNRYTFWSGITGGFFLALSYFGTDQSQVQRYLAGKSVTESRKGLLFNGLLKVPMQFFILLLGVLVFVFYQANQAPLFFNTQAKEQMYETPYASQFRFVEDKYNLNFKQRLDLTDIYIQGKRENKSEQVRRSSLLLKGTYITENNLRDEAKDLIQKALPSVETNDKDYIFINWMLDYLPKGLLGLLLAVILCAAMSSTASELNALASTSTVDIYKRSLRPDESESHYLKASRSLTFMWGVIAIAFASMVSLFENLIQFVNIIGSLFYGTILGIFLVGFFIKSLKSNAVFIAALVAESVVLAIYFMTDIGYLWLNVVGCALVIIVAFLLRGLDKNTASTT